jgi:hypothetical protein
LRAHRRPRASLWRSCRRNGRRGTRHGSRPWALVGLAWRTRGGFDGIARNRSRRDTSGRWDDRDFGRDRWKSCGGGCRCLSRRRAKREFRRMPRAPQKDRSRDQEEGAGPNDDPAAARSIGPTRVGQGRRSPGSAVLAPGFLSRLGSLQGVVDQAHPSSSPMDFRTEPSVTRSVPLTNP